MVDDKKSISADGLPELRIEPFSIRNGDIRLPGSKSISNRALLLAALADGSSRIHDCLDSDDTSVMLDALRRLGVQIENSDGDVLRIRGCAGHFPVQKADLFLGNAGTAFRPLTAILSILGGDYRLSGVARMHERPIGDLVDALRHIGARIDYTGVSNFPPLWIRSGDIRTTRGVPIRGEVSSQFVSALLMALPLSRTDCRLNIVGDLISRPYVDITINLMRRFGVEVRQLDPSTFLVPGDAYRSVDDFFVEGDASSASYFLAAGLLAGMKTGGRVRVNGVGRSSIQGDTNFVAVLEAMGATIAIGDNWIETTAQDDVRRRGKLRAIDLDLNHIPDAAMTAAILALFADSPSHLRNVGSWRVKETDRLSAMTRELRKLGADVEEGRDSLRITPPPAVTPDARIETYDDHRMAMCFSLVAMSGAPVRIADPACVRKTFPHYFELLATLARS